MSIVSKLARTGLRKGVLGGSRGWLYVGVAATSVRIAGRFLSDKPETIFETELHPGDTIEVRAVPPQP
jgi:hypothetical protein